jgi:hypothetical protein
MSRRKTISSSSLLAMASAASLAAAGAAFATGGTINYSGAPSLSLGASGLTQGLYATVWHVQPPNQKSGSLPGGSTASYGIPSPITSAPGMSDITTVESYLATSPTGSGYYDTASGVTYTLPQPTETFINTNDTFNYGLADQWSPTQQYLRADASGAAAFDGNPWVSSAIDQMGYIKVASAGSYTFNMKSADDAAAVYLGGSGITPTGNAGTGTQIVAQAYNSSTNTTVPVSDGTATVNFSSAGYYPIEIMNYQQGGGAGLNLSITNSAGKAASFYTTDAVASSVTPTPQASSAPTTVPTPTDEWNFAQSQISGTTVSDIGTSGSAATAGTIVGTAANVSNGALVVSSNNSGNGMTVPGSTFANYTGNFTIAVSFDRSTSDSSTSWVSLMAFGDKGAGGSQNFIILQPQRQDGSIYSSMDIQSNGLGTMLIQANGQPTPKGQKIVEVLTYNASTNTASLYINGVLQMVGNPISGTTGGLSKFSLAALADNVGTSSSPLTPQDGIGGVDSFGDPSSMASYYDLSTWDTALTGAQVAGLSAAATPEPASLATLALAVGGVLLASRKFRRSVA